MPLETATYVSDLNASNPAHSDGLNQADAHMRLTKAALKSTLPYTGSIHTAAGATNGPDGSASAPAFSFASEPTLGFYRMGPGVIGITGGKFKGGVPTGSLGVFVKEPASLGKTTADTGKDYLELNGATYNRVDYPDLADFMNGVGVGTTFTLPDMVTTGRFPRSRTAAVAALTAQANTVGPHTHPDITATTAAETQEHTHAFSGTTGVDSPDHTHNVTVGNWNNSSTGGGSFTINSGATTVTTGGANQRHAHSFSGSTGGRSATHNHTVLVSTPANTGTTETRPEAMSFVFTVKT
ncbi:hypothetical protein [Bradyrhizobium lupini]|uniref:hypothetical protein n=1 Tax=Rhizobium lupini TaxID=136996 RepID=UPI0034C5CC3F